MVSWMRSTVQSLSEDRIPWPRLPGWIIPAGAQTLENAAFLSGAALAHLQEVVAREDVPQALWRDRLALRAAAAGLALRGRPEREAELRDALHLLRPGDEPGPAGEVALAWRRAVERPLSDAALQRALPEIPPDRIVAWRTAGQGTPVDRVARVLETVLIESPRAETAALILADAALDRALGWAHLLPLLASGLKPRDLRRRGDDLRLCCHRALLSSIPETSGMASDLVRRAARLRAVAPKLRAKGAGRAVEVILSRDAVTPAALTNPLSDRAARRLCDRLVDLGVVRELTGRDMFRLYGL